MVKHLGMTLYGVIVLSLVCVMTSENEDMSWQASNEASNLCARVGRLVYDHFNSGVIPAANEKVLRIGASGKLEHWDRTADLAKIEVVARPRGRGVLAARRGTLAKAGLRLWS